MCLCLVKFVIYATATATKIAKITEINCGGPASAVRVGESGKQTKISE